MSKKRKKRNDKSNMAKWRREQEMIDKVVKEDEEKKFWLEYRDKLQSIEESLEEGRKIIIDRIIWRDLVHHWERGREESVFKRNRSSLYKGCYVDNEGTRQMNMLKTFISDVHGQRKAVHDALNQSGVLISNNFEDGHSKLGMIEEDVYVEWSATPNVSGRDNDVRWRAESFKKARGRGGRTFLFGYGTSGPLCIILDDQFWKRGEDGLYKEKIDKCDGRNYFTFNEKEDDEIIDFQEAVKLLAELF